MVCMKWIGGISFSSHVTGKVVILEKSIHNRTLQIVIRGFLNPTRSFANLIRGQKPWHRDNRE